MVTDLVWDKNISLISRYLMFSEINFNLCLNVITWSPIQKFVIRPLLKTPLLPPSLFPIPPFSTKFHSYWPPGRLLRYCHPVCNYTLPAVTTPHSRVPSPGPFSSPSTKMYFGWKDRTQFNVRRGGVKHVFLLLSVYRRAQGRSFWTMRAHVQGVRLFVCLSGCLCETR